MPFVKVVKDRAYFKRYQVKYRRRREGKTDYYARKRLIVQAKNKYNSPKYRLVVRFTNADIICQIIYAKIQGDVVMCSAYAHELPKYGVQVGLTNWAAAYCTGLLLARRVLAKLGLDTKYEGVTEVDGTVSITEENEEGPRPFKVFLDVGLKRTTTGARVFGAMKGASDGGLFVPHNEKRFPGYDSESKSLDSEVLRDYIFGQHVSSYMTALEEEDEEKYKRQFGQYIAKGIAADDIEEIYTQAHAKIRADPTFVPTKKNVPAPGTKSKYIKQTPLTLKERQNKVKQKKLNFMRQHGLLDE
ncbi:ribosomal protein-like protein L5 [Dimargaris cristalligena]|uniref:Ribosomal protein-like protein L5 n=1 Tax=Dimargaris cristalligena TaxID=215637 RepID=A0A4Q0A0B9_9FUNG|nr:ribosomal protein-like protein L5 [Dimargaris cristalligena]|eukprot:RKP39437.1 ribosomal protein-like protein L5 [Dimargaris cristalligena]